MVDVAAARDRRFVGGVSVPEQEERRQIEAVSELWNFYRRKNQHLQSVRSARWRLEERKARCNLGYLCETWVGEMLRALDFRVP